MADRGFLSDILARVSSQTLLGRGAKEPVQDSIEGLCVRLHHMKSEASVLILARQLLDHYRGLSPEGKVDFFKFLDAGLEQDTKALEAAIADWQPGDVAASRTVHFLAEPASQGFIRKLNSVPGATAELVAMRADLLGHLRENPGFAGLDADFQHLFASWFNRGFLEIRRIEWSTPASILEKIIAYEAVHEISDWDDLRRRVGDSDRRLFAFFHPAMPEEPLIFVEVALAEEVPSAIAPILDADRKKIDPNRATTAVFYSISNCQKGLRGISFGNFLIKQVVAELQRDLPQLKTFVTLSPVPKLRIWAGAVDKKELPDTPWRDQILSLKEGAVPSTDAARAVAAYYLTVAKRRNGAAYDPVAHFHLGNGATLHRIHADGDTSDRGLSNSWGVMVNYLYDDKSIDRNHQLYVSENKIATSTDVRALTKS